MEVAETYRDKLVSNEIDFLHASILDNTIPDDSFDIVTFRDMLHHLVADTVAGTLANQRRAFDELLRIVRPGGYLIFEEEVKRSTTSDSSRGSSTPCRGSPTVTESAAGSSRQAR